MAYYEHFSSASGGRRVRREEHPVDYDPTSDSARAEADSWSYKPFTDPDQEFWDSEWTDPANVTAGYTDWPAWARKALARRRFLLIREELPPESGGARLKRLQEILRVGRSNKIMGDMADDRRWREAREELARTRAENEDWAQGPVVDAAVLRLVAGQFGGSGSLLLQEFLRRLTGEEADTRFPVEPPDGSVLKYRITYPDGKTYTYVALRAGNRWYRTGRNHLPADWETVRAHIANWPCSIAPDKWGEIPQDPEPASEDMTPGEWFDQFYNRTVNTGQDS